MSDSVTKWHEMQEEKKTMIYESPDGGKTVTERPFGGVDLDRVIILEPTILSEGHKKQAYQILVDYPEEAILEATRILKNGK